jgi:hypothetical protein
MSQRRQLKAVHSISKRINDDQFRVAAQALVTGEQDIRVEAATPLVGPGHGQIAVRVGRLLVYVNDCAALDSFLDAWTRAEELADRAFGPVPGPQVYRPRSG